MAANIKQKQVQPKPRRQSAIEVNPLTWRTGAKATMTPYQVSEYTGFGLNHVYALLRSGKMPSIHHGSRWWIPVGALQAWLDSAGKKIA